jgi:hypothetical protein
MSTLPIVFKNTDELMEFAKDFFVRDRLDSLEKDVNHCVPYYTDEDIKNKIKKHSAPFPALMYCFSIIDLLGALYAGNARGGDTINNSKIHVYLS